MNYSVTKNVNTLTFLPKKTNLLFRQTSACQYWNFSSQRRYWYKL